MNNDDSLHICFACNENYRRGLWVTAATLLEANRAYRVVLHVLDGGLRPASIARLRRIASQVHRDVRLERHTINEAVFAKAPLGPGNSRMTYARLLCGSLFPELDRILYVDVDMLVTADLGAAIEGFSDGTLIAGALCPVVGILARDCAWPLAESEGTAPYINAGLLAVNLPAWRDAGIENAAIDQIKGNPEACRFWDQTVINYVCRGHIALLPERLNLPPEKWKTASCSEGGVIHYLAPEKPWAAWRPDPAYRLWRAAWRRHVGPTFLLLLSPTMAMSALRFLALGLARRSQGFSRILGRIIGLRQRIARDPVKQRILNRYRESVLAAPNERIEPVDPSSFFHGSL